MASPIQVTYTPQTTGTHVVCYQQVSPIDDLANFCCMLDSTVITPAMVGVPQIFTIPDVEVPSCDAGGTASPYLGIETTTFDGYVAPSCNLAMQTPWADPVVFVVAAP